MSKSEKTVARKKIPETISETGTIYKIIQVLRAISDYFGALSIMLHGARLFHSNTHLPTPSYSLIHTDKFGKFTYKN